MASTLDADVHSPSLSQALQHFYKAVKRTDGTDVFCSRQGGTLWRIGQTNTVEGADEPVLCKRGFHACRNSAAPFLTFLGYGYSHKTDVLLEVTLGGTLVSDGIKTAALSCTPVRVVPDEELAELMRSTTVVTDSKSGDAYYVKDGVLHCDGDEPAIIRGDGREWYKNGVLHRDGDKPARILIGGLQEWYKNGMMHRDEDKPTRILGDGSQLWYWNGVVHRDGDQPAVVMANGRQEWYKENKRHRDGDKPAVILADGKQEWYKGGKLHRDGDAPAVICADGSQAWYKDGKLHRDGDKPAIVDASGRQEWYKNGKLHREDGMPARVLANGSMEWYEDGVLSCRLCFLQKV